MDNKNSEKETQLFFVIRYNNQRFKIASGKKILPGHWNNANQKVNAKNKNAGSINALLKKRRGEIEKELDKLIFANRPINKEAILPFLTFGKMQKSSATAGLFKAYEFYIDSIKNHLSKNNIRNQNSAKKNLLNYCTKNKYTLTFESCNSIFYNGFVQYLVHEKNNQNSTIDKTTSLLKTFLNWATEEGYNENNDYKKFRAPSVGVNEIFALTKDELKQIEDYKPSVGMQKVKDLFLFECYTGLRYSDIQNLRPENIKDNKIEIITVKTKQKLFIPLHLKAQNILNKYKGNEFALPSLSNQKMNDYLKDLAEKAKINEEFLYTEYTGNKRIEKKCKKHEIITTHTGRHTFITISLLLGIDPETVKRITGHTTFKTFQKYIHYNDKTLIEQIQKWN